MSPNADRFDNWTQFPSCFSETIFEYARLALGGDAHNDPGSFKVL